MRRFAARELLARILPSAWVPYVLHLRPRALVIVIAHMSAGFFLANGLDFSTGYLGRWALAALPDDAVEVCIRLVGEAESRALNEQSRAKPQPTNVLSFPSEVPGLLGDIAICGPVTLREALDQGKQSDHHFAHLIVHGLLHLQGLDHETEIDAAEMEGREIRILEGMGIANPYVS